MTGIFNATRLAGHRLLVTGKGKQQAILDSTQWDHFKMADEATAQIDAYDKAVDDFFAPLVEALDAIEETAKPQLDPAFYIQVSAGTEAVEAEPPVIVVLDIDSAIARLIEIGETDRLVWVGNDRIEIKAE